MSKPTLIQKAVLTAIRKPGTFSLSELADAIGIGTEDVRGLLVDLTSTGELDLDPDQLKEATSIHVRKVISHADVVCQPKLVEGGLISREESGRDEFVDSEGRLIRASVHAELGPLIEGEEGTEGDGHTGRWILNVAVIKDGEVDYLPIECMPFVDPEGSAIGGKALAWAWFDEYRLSIEMADSDPLESGA